MELYLTENLTELRRRRGWGSRDVANALCCSARSVEAWENGSAEPSCGQLLQLSELYGVTLERLLTRPGEERAVPAPAAEELPGGDDDGDAEAEQLDALAEAYFGGDLSEEAVAEPEGTADAGRDAGTLSDAEPAADLRGDSEVEDEMDELFDLITTDVAADTRKTLEMARAFQKNLGGFGI